MPFNARVLVAGMTDVGRKRKHNEDSFTLVEDEKLFIVTDGMGGHASGEVASKMAIETMTTFFRATTADPEATWPYKMDKSMGYEENRLITGIKLANRRIFEAAQTENKLNGMGTTIVVLFVIREGCLLGHVGDSRIYRLREGVLDQLTENRLTRRAGLSLGRIAQRRQFSFAQIKTGLPDAVQAECWFQKRGPQPCEA